MPVIPPEQLVSLQNRTEGIRNFCLLAHVDHGKTTLADSLIASNGIISSRMAGTIRYLDSRPDEMERGITMMSSAISMYFKVRQSGGKEHEYLMNLIDSPGHVDFSSEVTSASRLCDGALILVDAVEGVCSQTVSVMRQAWVENLRPILVINKIDRLVTELRLTPLEAYLHLMRLLEQVNAVQGSFFTGQLMSIADGEGSGPAASQDPAMLDDKDIYFQPEKENVVFASAYDGWAFTVGDFAHIYAEKLGFKPETLQRTLWGDYYFDIKSKKVVTSKHLGKKGGKPMFVQFVLDNIWAIYENVVQNRNLERVEKIVKSLAIKVLPRDLKAKDSRNLLLAIFTQWLPLARAVLMCVASIVPSPAAAQQKKMQGLLSECPGGQSLAPDFMEAIKTCDQGSKSNLAYVSKMVAVPVEDLPQNQRKQLTAEEMRELARGLRGKVEEEGTSDERVTEDGASDFIASDNQPVQDQSEEKGVDEQKAEELIGFARIYCGKLSKGQTVFVYGPKYTPDVPDEHVTPVVIKDLYMMMGRELVALDSVPAGNTCGISGLEGKVLRSGTLSTERPGVNMASITSGQAPIVRVALEPKRPSEMKKLEEGMRLLNMADSCVEVDIQPTGEHIIVAAGELHLERCLKDLRERFAKIDIQSSKPIVPFRETIVAPPPPTASESHHKSSFPRGTSIVEVANGQFKFEIQVIPLNDKLTEHLNAHCPRIVTMHGLEDKAVMATNSASDGAAILEHTVDEQRQADDNGDKLLTYDEFLSELQRLLEAEPDTKQLSVDSIAGFGPRRKGPNILFDQTGTLRRLFASDAGRDGSTVDESSSMLSSLAGFIQTGFQIATQQGPLCSEPVQGTGLVLKNIQVADATATSHLQSNTFGGQVISAIRDGFRQGFLDWSPRLMLAMYSCDIQATTEVLGKVYAVVNKRHGHIVAEEMKEGTPFFNVRALVPVVEAFGFADDIRKRTSGAASPQLIFAGFQILDQDPFWVPTTEEELEDLGELADRENIARAYMDTVRIRKGLKVDRKIIKNAEKQRNLKK